MSLPAHELRRLRAVSDTDDEFDRFVARRLDGEPLQYLEGTAAFGPFELHVDRRVLIPRPETEQLWELATGLVGAPRVVVDLCTGSGALAIALSHSFPDARVFGTDVSAEALEVAQLNGNTLHAAIEWCSGDLFSALPEHLAGSIDLLVSNPPYVAEAEYSGLPADVRQEPKVALVSGPSGLEVYERIAAEVGDWLADHGRFALEIGETQAHALLELFADYGPQVRQDLAGRDRFVIGVKA